ncbi:hypothetical protein [Pleomorphomonas carboxyditropha]|uniref:Secreted protein n=1 Tax=Pleomorphomonas carboxyditropha TaxID=2023338 RepID=A0A2G9WVJ8_9HYPH|nr:hypothetical protein [Pleomorphomonas carboxyditropha]PIO98703.1 hypothetical protein CJ014_13425 [Pleomorphomonas carboxyditropha]
MRISIGAPLFAAAIAVSLSLCAASTALAFGLQSSPETGRSPGSGYGFSVPGDDGSGVGTGTGLATPPDEAASASLPEVRYDLSTLPPAVAAMREKIVAAARSGDETQMRAVIGLSSPPPLFSSTGEGDPIDILKAASGDTAGLEVLAILLDVLDAGWVVKGDGTPQARYVWPYFAELPPDTLDRRQLVEVYRVLTAGDFEEMRAVGSYEFYRLEIAADGRWLLFMTGE